jgi:hypothetical protein
MYNPSLQQQLVKARINDIRRARLGQPSGHALVLSRASNDGDRPRRHLRQLRPRVVSRLAH